tara:strand:+ start:4389 stop:4883 length:495 start_codon:yes stop_codon:yes gene_type:complete
MLTSNNNRFYLCLTRFNNQTFFENERYRTKIDHPGCLYGSPCEMPFKIPLRSKIFVLEINNEENKIMGIGYLYNKPYFKNRHFIYTNNDYNRYLYVGKYRVDRNELSDKNKKFLEVLEKRVFYGHSHQKRGHGFNTVSKKNLLNIRDETLSWLCDIFLEKYTTI